MVNKNKKNENRELGRILILIKEIVWGVVEFKRLIFWLGWVLYFFGKEGGVILIVYWI